MPDATWGIDTIDAQVQFLSTGVPVIWPYITGTTQRPEIEWEPADLALFRHSMLYKLDQGFGDQGDRARWFRCHEFDLESGAWTIPELVKAIEARNSIMWSTRVYASVGPWQALLGAMAAAGVSARSLYWREANWNLSESEARGLLSVVRYAIQWASPSSRPLALIPGTSVTLNEAGADLNVVRLTDTGWRG